MSLLTLAEIIIMAMASSMVVAAKDWIESTANYHTKKARNYDIKCFFSFLKEDVGEIPSYKELKRLHLEKWLDAQIEVGSASSTIQRRLANITSFLNILSRKEKSPSPAVGVMFSTEQSPPRWLSRSELEEFREALYLSGKTEEKRIRNIAIVETFLSTGLRVAELKKLRRKQLDTSKWALLNVWCKGRKIRDFYLNKTAKKALGEYLKLREEKLHNIKGRDGEFPLFVSIWNGETSFFGEKTLWRIVHSIGKDAGLDISPHNLRHTFIKNIERKYGIAIAQKAAGHSSTNMTLRYSQATEGEIKRAVNIMNIEGGKSE